jgi:hypothetical protein
MAEEDEEKLLKAELDEKEKRNKLQAKNVTEQFQTTLNALPQNTVKSARISKEEALHKSASRSKGEASRNIGGNGDIEMAVVKPIKKARGAGVSNMVSFTINKDGTFIIARKAG